MTSAFYGYYAMSCTASCKANETPISVRGLFGTAGGNTGLNTFAENNGYRCLMAFVNCTDYSDPMSGCGGNSKCIATCLSAR